MTIHHRIVLYTPARCDHTVNTPNPTLTGRSRWAVYAPGRPPVGRVGGTPLGIELTYRKIQPKLRVLEWMATWLKFMFGSLCEHPVIARAQVAREQR